MVEVLDRLSKIRFRHELRWYWAKTIAATQWQRLAERYRWIFILGCNNSGTTLLTRLLSVHPDISSVPLGGRGATTVLPRPKEAGVARLWTERLDLFRLTEADQHCDSLRLIYDWISALRIPSRPLVLEKAPPDMICSRWFQAVFPDASFIGLVRNGYAVAEGIKRREGYPLERCARHWNTANKIMLDDSAYLKRFMLVRYEDLIKAPRKTVKQICQFLRIDSSLVEAATEAEWQVHNLENAPAKIQDFNVKSLASLSRNDVEVIKLHASEMLERFAYFLPGAHT